MNSRIIELECSTCVFYDDGTCMKYKDHVDPHFSCDDYDQDEEPEPCRTKNKKKKHRSNDDE